jgi:uncharacterized membrane protein
VTPPLARAVTVHALATAALSIAHSVRARGGQSTVVFLRLGMGIPALGEYTSVHLLHRLRHHVQPQISAVPLSALFGWYNIGYASFAIMESLLAAAQLSPGMRWWMLPAGTALLATDLDLLMDCWGLDAGLWQWTSSGQYARDIKGVNGEYGIPWDNFTSWLLLTGCVTLLYQVCTGKGSEEGSQAGTAGSVEAGRTAALLLLPYYLASLVWAIRRRKVRYVFYAGLVPCVLAAALWGMSTSPDFCKRTRS